MFVRPGWKYVFKSISCERGQQEGVNGARKQNNLKISFFFFFTVTAAMSFLLQ